jgi:autotransporter-associated beta strand protein
MMSNWWRALTTRWFRVAGRKARPLSAGRRRRCPLTLEALEGRLTPTVDITAFNVAAGTVTFTGDSTGPSADGLILSESGGFLAHNLLVIGGTGNYASATDMDPGIGVAQIAVGSGTTPLVTVNLATLNDSLTFDNSWTFAHPVNYNGDGGSNALVSNDGDDTFVLSSPSSGTLNGNVAFSNVQALDGSNFVTANTVYGENAPRTWTVTSGTTATYAGVLSLTNMTQLQGGSDVDTFDITGNVPPPTVSLSLSLFGNGGNDDFVFADGVSFGSNTIDGGSGTDTVDFSTWSTGLFAMLTSTGTSDGFAGQEFVAGVNFDNIDSLNGSTSSNDDLLFGVPTGGTWDIDGSDTYTAGNVLAIPDWNTLVSQGGPNVFNVSTNHTGDLIGSTGTDDFNFIGAGSLTGVVVGDGSTDTLDFSAYGSPVSALLTGSDPSGYTGTVSVGVSGGFFGIDTLTGSAGADTLQGEDVASNWVADATSTYDDNAGNGVLTFFGFEFLQGGSDVDTFDVTPQPNPGTGLTIDGGAPTLADPPPGDTLNLHIAALAPPPGNATLEVTGPGAGMFTTTNYQTLTFSNIENFTSDAPIPNIIIDGTATATDFRIVRNGANEEIRDITGVASGWPGSLYFNVSYASLSTLTIKGTTAQANRVVLDFGGSGTPIPDPNGNPIPSGGFAFNGKGINNGPAVGNDRLFIGATDATGTPSLVTFSAVATTYTSATDGSTTFADTTPTPLGTVNFTNLDAYDLAGGLPPTETAYTGSVAIQDLTFTLPSGAIGATFRDAGTATDNVSQLVTTAGLAFVPTNFADPSNSLTVNTTAPGNDTVLLRAMDNGFAPTLINFNGNSTGDTYQLQSTAFFQAPAPGVTLTSATLDLNGFSDTVAWLEDSSSVAGTSRLALNGAATLTTGDAANHKYNGQITGNGNLVKQGTGDWTLGGSLSNTYTGLTTVNAGRLLLNKNAAGTIAVGGNLTVGDGLGGNDADIVRWIGFSNQLNAASVVTVNNTGLLDLNNFSNTVRSLALQSDDTFGSTVSTGTGTLTLNAGFSGGVTLTALNTGAVHADINGKLDLGGLSRDFTVARGTALPADDLIVNAVISGGGLNKLGAGVLALAGANTYTGGTNVNLGTLTLTATGVINATALSTAGIVNLNTAGVVLNGSGVVNGKVVVVASNNSSAASNTHIDGLTITVVSTGGTGLVVDGVPTVGTPATFVQIGVTAGITVNGGNATSTGILVQKNASAKIFNSVIGGQNVDVTIDGGLAALQTDTLTPGTGSFVTGLLVKNGGIVDAGQTAASATPLPNGPANNRGYYGDITGLFSGTPLGSTAHSSGGNTFGTAGSPFSLDTSATATAGLGPNIPQAIRDNNTGAAPFGALPNGVEQSFNYGGVGPQLGRMDVTAQSNIWNGNAALPLFQIEQLIQHDLDDNTLGFVTYGNATAPPPQITATPRYFANYAQAAPSSGFGNLANGDNTNLVLNSAGAQKSVIRGVEVVYSSFVFLDPNLISATSNRGLNLRKLNGPGGAPANTLINVSLSPFTSYNRITGAYTVVYSFNSGPGVEFAGLEDGNYSLQINAGAVQGGGPGGPALTASGSVDPASYNALFFRYYGDTNGDRAVNNTDFTAMQAAMNSQIGQTKYRAYLDYSNAGYITSADYNQFLRRYKTRLNADGTTTAINP